MSVPGSRTRALAYVAGVLVLTSIHHVYGAMPYATPCRYHAVILAAVTLAVVLVAYRRDRTRAGRLAGRTFWIVNALYFAGLSGDWMNRLFPPPTYEMPNDLLFEVTGVLQVVPAALAGYHLVQARVP